MTNDILSNVWPEWRIVKRIGSGSFGVVYEAIRKDHNVESHAAIKIISIPQNESEIDSLRSEGLSMDATKTYLQEVVNDFVSEIQLMQSFKGIQNIVSVEDYKVIEKSNEIGWDIYIRMELLTPLNSYIADKTLTEVEVIKLGCDICTALEHCTKRSVIHRDIKPENIFINPFGDFKLGDFGIARKLENATGAFSQKGTYNYMAPEIEKGTQYDGTVDLYSLGLVLYRFMNKNRLPFLDTERQLLNPNERMAAIRRRMDGEPLPAPCDASPAMAQVILCACSPDPSRRFASATEMKTVLIGIANGTYTDSEDVLNKTMSVRHAAPAQDSSSTTAAHKVPKMQKPVPTFGSKKEIKILEVIAAVLVVLLLVGGGVFVISKNFGNKDGNESAKENSSTAYDLLADDADGINSVYSDFDKEQIAAAIEEAEVLAMDMDYEGALTKIKAALVTYPKSEVLQAKETEYTDALAAQVKGKTLEEAASLAELGDYVSAITLIKSAQETNGDDPDYISVYNTYCASYKDEAISVADELASNKDYIGAVQEVNKALSIIGEDSELDKKVRQYEDTYVSGVISQVDDLITASDFETADNVLESAVNAFPNNQVLQNEKVILDNQKPKQLLSVCPPYETWYYSEETAIKMGGQTYTDGFVLSGSFANGSGAYYNLEGKYDTLEFDLGHVDGTHMHDATLEISLDGETIQVIDMKAQDLPKHYVIPLNGATQMKITQSQTGAEYAVVNAVLYPNQSVNNVNTRVLASDIFLITECPPYETWGYSEETAIKMGGQTYTDGFVLSGSFANGSGAYYNLEGKYDTLEFDLGHVDGTHMHDATLEISLDGETIQVIDMKAQDLPKHYVISLNGATQMKITQSQTGAEYAVVNAVLY